MEINKLVRPSILSLKGYSSARDEFSGNDATLLDANENPFPTKVNRYPDPYQRELKKKIAELKEVSIDQIFLGNGSDEAIDLIFRIFCEPGVDNIATVEPTYGMYQVSADINNIPVTRASLTSDFTLDSNEVLTKISENTKIIFLCSPNNPSGNDLEASQINTIIENFKGIVVVDEAYIDFAEQPSFTKRLNDYQNLIVLQTFSKAWGMAGLRLGMAFASPQIIKLFNKVKPPYNVNTLTQQYAIEALSNVNEVTEKIRTLIKERTRLTDELEQLKIVKRVFPSAANFLLVRFENASEVFNYLTDLNIIVRDRSKVRYGDNCLRITIGTEKENTELLNALKKL